MSSLSPPLHAPASRTRPGLLAVAALALLAGAALFFGGIRDIVHRWASEPEWNHGFISAAVIAWYLWHHRAQWRALPLHPSAVGTVLVALAALGAVAGELSATYFVSQYGLVLLLAGLVLSIWGAAGLRLIALPLLLFAVVVPVPYFVEASLSVRLQLLSSDAGVAVLQALSIAAHNDGNVIDLGAYQLDVAEACSGLRYLFPLLGLSVIIAALYRGPLWPRVVTVLLASPVAIAMNVLRIALVGVLVSRSGIAAAEGFLHLFEGWAIFLLCSLLLLAALAIANRFVRPRAGLLDRFGLAPAAARRTTGVPVTAAAPRPLLAATAIMLVLAGVTALLRTRPDAVPPHPAVATFPLQVGPWTGHPLALSAMETGILDHPDYMLATYTRPDGAIANLFVAYYARQQQGAAIHSPRACLPGGGWKVLSTRQVPVSVPGGSVPMNRVLIERDRDREIVYYGFDQRGRWMTNEYGVKLALLWDAVTRNRTDGALVRLVGPIRPTETEAIADAHIRALLTDSYPTIVQFVPR